MKKGDTIILRMGGKTITLRVVIVHRNNRQYKRRRK
jgi:hypothetical protein